jgi:histone H3/H4
MTSDTNAFRPEQHFDDTVHVGIAGILKNLGVASTQPRVIQTLKQLYVAFLLEIGRSSRLYAEHGGRVTIILDDVMVALANAGIDIRSVRNFVKSGQANFTVTDPDREAAPNIPAVLAIGKRLERVQIQTLKCQTLKCSSLAGSLTLFLATSRSALSEVATRRSYIRGD